MPAKKTEVKKTKSQAGKTGLKETPQAKKSDLKVSVYDLKGIKKEEVFLPEEVFGVQINRPLLAQAVRVYLANKRQGSASSKTRGEVRGSTRKIYRQKGTGRARHGGVRAPLFVHGGVAHGPKSKDYSLEMPQKMRRAALFSSLSLKAKDDLIRVVTGFKDLDGKTKNAASFFKALSLDLKKEKALLVLPKNDKSKIKLAVRNLAGLETLGEDSLNAYSVLAKKYLILLKEAIPFEKKKEQ